MVRILEKDRIEQNDFEVKANNIIHTLTKVERSVTKENGLANLRYYATTSRTTNSLISSKERLFHKACHLFHAKDCNGRFCTR
jgi:hypothetical protein